MANRILFILVFLALPPAALHADEVNERLRDFANRIPYLVTSDFLNDRMSAETNWFQTDEELETAYLEFWEFGHSLEFEDIEFSLSDDDPRVRSLAIVCAYWSGDPRKWMEQVHGLVSDDAESIPSVPPIARPLIDWPGQEDVEQPIEPKTVGDTATAAIQMYMEAAGYHYGIEGIYDNPGFDEYWEKRKNLDYCFSWFQVQFQIATQQTSPLPEDRMDRVRAVRARVARVPSPDREWILLSLGAPYEWGSTRSGAFLVANEEQLVQACKELGPDALMSFLKREKVSDHPELDFENENLCRAIGYSRMAVFILGHAKDLLRTSDAGELLELISVQEQLAENGQPHFPSPRWAMAAADLLPAQSVTILRNEMKRIADEEFTTGQDKRALVVNELWKHAGEEAIPEILDWFFAETPDRGAVGMGRHRLCNFLDETGYQQLLTAILSDQRLDSLDWGTLDRVVRATNKAAGREIVIEDALNRAWHPLGMASYHWNLEAARRDYPEETEILEQHLKAWQEAMHEFAQNPVFDRPDGG